VKVEICTADYNARRPADVMRKDERFGSAHAGRGAAGRPSKNGAESAVQREIRAVAGERVGESRFWAECAKIEA